MPEYTIPTSSTPTPDSPEYIQSMIDKGEGKPSVTPENLLAGKYKTEADLEKGILELARKSGNLEEFYKNLEKSSLGKTATPTTPPTESPASPTETQTTPTEEKTPTNDDVSNLLVAKGLDPTEFVEEINANGQLSEESYAKLQSAGFPKALVEEFIAGKQAMAERALKSVYDSAGGETQLKQMLTWAATGLSESEIDAFNSVMKSGNMAQVGLAVAGLKAKFESVVGKRVSTTPDLVTGVPSGGSQVAGYSSTAEMVSDMKDPRYKKDPAFRAMVEQKIRWSKAI